MHNYALAKTLVEPLSLLSTNQYSVKNSFEFVNEITSFDNCNFYMCSFDVESLFTNVPLKETVEICLQTLFYDNSCSVLGLNKTQFSHLLDLALNDTFFTFNNSLY